MLKHYFPVYFSLDIITAFLLGLKLGGINMNWGFVFIPTLIGIGLYLTMGRRNKNE